MPRTAGACFRTRRRRSRDGAPCGAPAFRPTCRSSLSPKTRPSSGRASPRSENASWLASTEHSFSVTEYSFCQTRLVGGNAMPPTSRSPVMEVRMGDAGDLAVLRKEQSPKGRSGDQRCRSDDDVRLGPPLTSFGALVVVLLVAGCRQSEAPAPPPPPRVEVAPVRQQDVPIYREWVATLDGYVNAQIQPQVTGYLLRQDFREGSFVRKDDLLFEIDPRPFDATLA